MKIDEAINKSVFFIGAGASKDAQCKMSSEMFTALKDIVCGKTNDYFSKTECEAVKFLLSCLHYHSEWRSLEANRKYPVNPNIEELALLIRRVKNRENFLPYPITGNWADKLTILETKFQEQSSSGIGIGLFEKLDDTIKNVLLPQWLEVQNTSYLKPLDDFFVACNDTEFQLEVFSLNNDLVFETHFAEAMPYRGFYSGEWRGLDARGNVEEYNRINLYKLHGSLDWVRLNDGSVWERGQLNEEFFDEENRVEHDPFIIFGHGSKFFSVDPFFSLIQSFKEKLKERSYFFIIGYSFFDPYINNLLIQAVKDGRDENKKIIIINPSFAFPPLKESHFEINPMLGVRQMIPDNSEAKKALSDYLEDIQKNVFYSELPEFNIKQVPTEALMYFNTGTHEFLNSFFSNGGDMFIEFISKLEEDRNKDLPF